MRTLLCIIGVSLTLSACASKPVEKRGYELPPALREVFRGGELAPLQASDAQTSGIPSAYDQVGHVCASSPVYGYNGRYVRTIVRCW